MMGQNSECSGSSTNLNSTCVFVDQFVRSHICQLLQLLLGTGDTSEAVIMHISHGRDGLFQVFLWIFLICNMYVYLKKQLFLHVVSSSLYYLSLGSPSW